jgi:hypothetical protein
MMYMYGLPHATGEMAGAMEGFHGNPVMYHCISRVVDRQFVLGDVERERFRMLMRMQENFSGCRVLSYVIMSNQFHLLLEVPPMAEGGLSDQELLQRLSVTSSEAAVAEVAKC